MMKIINKILKTIGKLLKPIIKFIDKFIITPLAKLILTISDLFKNKGNGLEKLLNNKQILIILSLIFALIAFFLVDRESIVLIDTSAEVLYGQKVTAIYNEEAYVVEGLPEKVDISLIGRKSDVYLAKQYPAQEVSVDLRDLAPGSHTVKLKYSQDVSSVDYKLDPSTVSIVIYEKVSANKTLSYDVVHKDKLDSKLQISDVDLSRSEVIIKGAEYKLEQVATVKALIDVENITNPAVGETKLRDIPLVAYDSKGKVVDVEIVPETVDANIKISSPSKEVALKIIPTGKLSLGKGIESIDSSVSNITIYGNLDALDKIDSIPVKVDINGLSDDKEYNINIAKPSGVRELDTKVVNVKVKVGSLTNSKNINDVYIETKNLGTQYKVQALSEDDSKVTVLVKGTKSVLDSIDPSTISAYIDLSDYGVGEYEVKVKVTGTDLRATYSTKVKKVKIKISEK